MDGTENQKDASQVGDTSGGGKGTSEKTPETFTREDMDKVSQKAASDALSKAGRTATALEKREVAIKTAEEKASQDRKDKHDADITAAGDDKDAVSRVRARHEHSETKSKLARVEQELEGEREKVKEAGVQTQEIERTQKAAEIAVKYGVDFNTLVKFTDGSPEAMEELAQRLSKKGEVEPVKLDSGKTTGGEKSDEQRLKERYPKMKH